MPLEAVRTMPDAGGVDVEAAETAVADLLPRGAGVVLEAEHLCMSIRGVQAAGTLTRGVLTEQVGLRDRFLD